MSVSASVSSEMAAQSTFSYAQAAKGQGTVPSNTTPNSTAQAEDSEVPPPAVKSATSEADQPESVEAPAPASPETSEVKPATSEKQEVESIQGSEGDAKPESVQERRPESRREEEVGKLDRPWRRNDKGTRSSSTTTRSDDQDSRRARRGKKGKAAEKQSGEQATAEKEQEAEPEPPKVELFEAPIPSVNIWHQRQQAKGPSTTEAAVNGAAGQLDENKPLAKSTEETTPSGTRDVPHVNGVKSQRKPVEPTRTERNGPRGSRLADKDSRAAALPAVEDASSWPTPETSIKEAAKDEKRKTTDRSDRSDKDSQEDGVGGQSKKGKDKWVTYDYVPTVSFETQLPQMRNSKPRGGARTGRESGPRASAESLPGKATPTAPSNKSTGSGDRSREVNGSHRATSQPPAAKRASLDNSREQKKAAGQTCSDKGKDVTAPALVSYKSPACVKEEFNDPSYHVSHATIVLLTLTSRRMARLRKLAQRVVMIEDEAATVDVEPTMLSTPRLSINNQDLKDLQDRMVQDPMDTTAPHPARVPTAGCTCLRHSEDEEVVTTTSTACRCLTLHRAVLLFRPSSVPTITTWPPCLLTSQLPFTTACSSPC